MKLFELTNSTVLKLYLPNNTTMYSMNALGMYFLIILKAKKDVLYLATFHYFTIRFCISFWRAKIDSVWACLCFPHYKLCSECVYGHTAYTKAVFCWNCLGHSCCISEKICRFCQSTTCTNPRSARSSVQDISENYAKSPELDCASLQFSAFISLMYRRTASRVGWATAAAAAFLMKNQTRKWTPCLRYIRRLLSSLDSYPSRRSAISMHALSRCFCRCRWIRVPIDGLLQPRVLGVADARSKWLGESEDFTSVVALANFILVLFWRFTVLNVTDEERGLNNRLQESTVRIFLTDFWRTWKQSFKRIWRWPDCFEVCEWNISR